MSTTEQAGINNIAINITSNKVSLIEGAVILEKQGYKGSWKKLTPRQLQHLEVEDAETKQWIKLSDKEPKNCNKEVKVNVIFAKAPVYGSSSPDEAREKATTGVQKIIKTRKKKEIGGKVSKISTEEAIKLSQG